MIYCIVKTIRPKHFIFYATWLILILRNKLPTSLQTRENLSLAIFYTEGIKYVFTMNKNLFTVLSRWWHNLVGIIRWWLMDAASIQVYVNDYNLLTTSFDFDDDCSLLPWILVLLCIQCHGLWLFTMTDWLMRSMRSAQLIKLMYNS